MRNRQVLATSSWVPGLQAAVCLAVVLGLVMTLCLVLTEGVNAGPARPGLGTIGGQVVAQGGKPVARARVTLQSADGNHPQTTETNGEGRFSFPSLREGLYDLRAYSEGRVSEWRKNVTVIRGQQASVILLLHPEKPAPSKWPYAVPYKAGS